MTDDTLDYGCQEATLPLRKPEPTYSYPEKSNRDSRVLSCPFQDAPPPPFHDDTLDPAFRTPGNTEEHTYEVPMRQHWNGPGDLPYYYQLDPDALPPPEYMEGAYKSLEFSTRCKDNDSFVLPKELTDDSGSGT